jgi:hypothetical protein
MARARLSSHADVASGLRIGPGKISLLEIIRSTRSISAAASTTVCMNRPSRWNQVVVTAGERLPWQSVSASSISIIPSNRRRDQLQTTHSAHLERWLGGNERQHAQQSLIHLLCRAIRMGPGKGRGDRLYRHPTHFHQRMCPQSRLRALCE